LTADDFGPFSTVLQNLYSLLTNACTLAVTLDPRGDKLPREVSEMKIALAKMGLLLAASSLLWSGPVNSGQHAIDPHTSVMTVKVYKAGVLSALGHDHEIVAPIAGGKVDTNAQSVELNIDAGALRVRDPKASEADRDEIQKTMLGPEVLDVQRNARIVFRSTAVQSAGPGSWTLQGNLTLHGQTRPVTVSVSERQGHYVGHSLLKQTDFGIKPVRKAGGTVRVKDEIRIEFDIQLD
jgi:polyisoprenoid-binding protein YceI